ncbi:Na(+)/H(+) antiporter subunit C [uncultured Corynebacterium sp.]|uniref:Na(+)/H(+) antiporter subunit C n=1 Tax=uncultured Corynebacterium sp. TaxID=159447 RepID=UPI0025DE929D|nr:Na(+)/H(+) antiporter subunit C [uncultured Corynebacterium sp.]
MDANLFLLLAAGTLCGAGVYLMLDRAMTKMIIGVLLLGNGANLLLLQAGGGPGSPPIVGRETAQYGEHNADPLAQGMILTAIVISMAMTAFMLALAYKQFRYRTADVIEDDKEVAPVTNEDASSDPATGKATEAGDAFGPSSFEGPVEEASPEDREDDDAQPHAKPRAGATTEAADD